MNKFVEEFRSPSTDVALCGSMAHRELWLKVIQELESRGLTVSTPDMSETVDWSDLTEDEIVVKKGRFVRRHFANISLAEVVLVCNYSKNGIDNYIGVNSLMEMTAGFVFGKPLYLLNAIPNQNGREEILAMEPILLNGSIDQLLKDLERAK